MRERLSLCRDWEFTERFSEAFSKGLACETVTVNLPHTCRETPYHYFDDQIYQMVCGYRKRVTIPDDWTDKDVFLCIGAAGHYAEVYCNGEKVGSHACGYTAFEVPLPLKAGETGEIAVMVDSRESLDQPPFGFVIDYMTYGGLYREVWLDVCGQTSIEDVFACPAPDDGLPLLGSSERAEVRRALALDLRVPGTVGGAVTLTGGSEGCALRFRLTDDSGMLQTEHITPVTQTVQRFGFSVPEVGLWDVDAPRLYTLETALLRGQDLLDRVETRIGFRRVEWKPDGFYLNARKLKILGLNRHQSYPYVGYAMPRSMQRLDAEILKYELGCNAVRTSHYPQSPHFIDRCSGSDEHIMVCRIVCPDLQTADDPRFMHRKEMRSHHFPVFVMGFFPNIRRNRHAVICFHIVLREIFDFH